jgi:hypothetical protein
LLTTSLAFAGHPGAREGATPIRLRVPVVSDGAFGAGDVRATVNGAEARVLSVGRADSDLILLVVMDLAGDLTLAQSATSTFLEQLDQFPKNVYVGLLRAQDSLKVLEDPTRDRVRIRKAVEELPLTGRAGLLTSVETVAGIASTMLARSPVRVAILYLTDSEVTNYREDFTNPVINSSDAGDLSRKFPEALIQEKIAKVDASLAATSAPVFVVHTTWRSDRLNTAYLDGLQQIAVTTGGSAVICRSLAEVPDAVRDTLNNIRSHSLVTLETPRTPGKAAEVRLELADSVPRPSRFTYRARYLLKTKR